MPSTPPAPAPPSPTALLKQSTLLLARSRPHQALCAADQALAAHPTPAAHLARGAALSAAGATSAALASLARAASAPDPDPAALAAYGTALASAEPLRIPEALTHLRDAVARGFAPARHSLAALLTDVGVRLARAGLPAEAFAKYEEAVAVVPTYAQAWYNMAVCSSDVGSVDRALVCYRECVAINPGHCQAWVNVGVLQRAAGKVDDAIAAYERALGVDANYELARRNLAIALVEKATTEKGRIGPRAALAVFKRALELQPAFADTHYCMGVAYAELGKTGRALACYALAAHFNPGLIEAHHNAAVVYKLVGNFDAAITSYKAALAVDEKHHKTHSDVAVIYTLLGDVERASHHLRVALSLAPDHAESHNNAGVLERDLGDIDTAILHYERCAALDSSTSIAAQNRLHALNYTDAWPPHHTYLQHVEWGVGFYARVVQQMQHAVEAANQPGALPNTDLAMYMAATSKRRPHVPDAIPRGPPPQSVVGVGGAGSTGEGTKRSIECGFGPGKTVTASGGVNGLSRVAKKDATPSSSPLSSRSGTPPVIPALHSSRALRVGYVSPDYFTHSVSYFLEVLLAHHTPTKVEVYAYANVGREDAKTAKLRAYPNVKGRWRDIWGKNAVAVASMVIEDGIDILIDCTGHTASNRLDVFALSPAPVLVTWIGYPNTTGLSTIHYRITDARADPVDTTQQFTERLWRLPDCFLCYTPSDEAPPVAKTIPCIASGGIITFASFNVLAKTQSRTIAMWARILKRVPHSRLLLKSKALGAPSGRARMQSLFEAVGVPVSRLDFVPLLSATSAHLAQYHTVDIALDPFPYAGTTTTCESLYMGVPVVTLATPAHEGDHANCVGRSLLHTIGHSELIGENEGAYEEIAVALANDPARLAYLRQNLRREMMESPLGDAMRYVGNVEAMMFGMWNAQGGNVARGVPIAFDGSAATPPYRNSANANGTNIDRPRRREMPNRKIRKTKSGVEEPASLVAQRRDSRGETDSADSVDHDGNGTDGAVEGSEQQPNVCSPRANGGSNNLFVGSTYTQRPNRGEDVRPAQC